MDQQLRLQLEYDDLSRAPHGAVDAAIGELNRKIGYIDRTIEDLEQRHRIAERIASIIDLQASLASDMSKLEEDIANRKSSQEQTKQDAYTLISGLTIDLLKRDLPRETAFEEATLVHFDFGSNRITVDGRSTFAASSNVYLKNAFHLALLQASTMREYMRYPRLAVFDNVEDKGMESARSHNFQNIVREWSITTEVEHQIILFTSMVAPELERDSNVLVGPAYRKAAKTLRFGGDTMGTL